MPEFRFSMIVDGVERVEYVEIEERYIHVPDNIDNSWKDMYRHNRIQIRLKEWATTRLKLSYEEVNTNESKSSKQHHTDEQQEEKEADKGRFCTDL